MINYIKLSELDDLTKIKHCWNEENAFAYPISDQLFKGTVVENKELLRSNSFVALDNDEVVGFILCKAWDEQDKLIPTYQNIGWVSLIYVKRKYRKKGIGTELLRRGEEGIRLLGKKVLMLGTDTYNFFPGLPVDFVQSKSWFEKQGFVSKSESFDMIRYFEQSNEPIKEPETPYEVRVATKDDEEALIAFFERCFKGRWEFEAKAYFAKGGTGREFTIVKDGDKVIAFCRLNDQSSPEVLHNVNWSDRFTNHGGVGPLGVDPEYRKQNLGFAVTSHAINEIQRRGCHTCIIDWTGLVDFYRLFGFEVWKTYYRFEKNLD